MQKKKKTDFDKSWSDFPGHGNGDKNTKWRKLRNTNSPKKVRNQSGNLKNWVNASEKSDFDETWLYVLPN